MKMSFVIFLLTTTLYCSETTILIFRHGQTDANRYRIVQGHIDYPLNEIGIEQAKALADQIFQRHPDIDAIYSSDLTRATHTAKETAILLQLPIQTKRALREMSYGIAEGMAHAEFFAKYSASFEELNQQYPIRKERWDHTNVPESETSNQLLERVKEKLTEIAEHHANEKIAVFSHGGAICTFLTDLLGYYPKLSNCDGAILLYKDGHFTFLKEENLLKD